MITRCCLYHFTADTSLLLDPALQRHPDYFHQPLIYDLIYASSSDCGHFCVGKRALLLQNVLKLILQEISVDHALYNIWSHPALSGKREGVGSLWWLLAKTNCHSFGVECTTWHKGLGKTDWGWGEKMRRGVLEHTQRANMTQEMLAKAQTGWVTERDTDKSL